MVRAGLGPGPRARQRWPGRRSAVLSPSHHLHCGSHMTHVPTFFFLPRLTAIICITALVCSSASYPSLWSGAPLGIAPLTLSCGRSECGRTPSVALAHETRGHLQLGAGSDVVCVLADECEKLHVHTLASGSSPPSSLAGTRRKLLNFARTRGNHPLPKSTRAHD